MKEGKLITIIFLGIVYNLNGRLTNWWGYGFHPKTLPTN